MGEGGGRVGVITLTCNWNHETVQLSSSRKWVDVLLNTKDREISSARELVKFAVKVIQCYNLNLNRLYKLFHH